MKVWITKPTAHQFHGHGMTHAQLWVTEPFYDHRPLWGESDLYDRATGKFVATAMRELGWSSGTNPTDAKPFLKQDFNLKKKVWMRMYESFVPKDCPDPLNKELSESEFDLLLGEGYDMRCLHHWKRWLLEVDLSTFDVRVVPARVSLGDGRPNHYPSEPINDIQGTYYLYMNGDLTRPFSFSTHPHLVAEPYRGI